MKQAVETKEKSPGEDVAQRAYGIWESKGRPPGRDLECWLEAENQARPKPASRGKNGSRPGASN